MLVARFLCAIIALAMLLAPVGMRSDAALMAMPQDSMSEMAAHCEKDDTEKEQAGSEANCCVTTCSALAAGLGSMAQVAPGEPILLHASLINARSGLSPEAETPPPRFS